jgi:hypothetical protein
MPLEDELEGAFRRSIDEGMQRLHRPWREVLVTGFFGGTEVSIGFLALGGWLIMWVIMSAFPSLHEQTVESATHYATAPLSRETFCLALLAGAVITLMTRMQHGTDCMPAKIVAAVAGGFLLAGLEGLRLPGLAALVLLHDRRQHAGRVAARHPAPPRPEQGAPGDRARGCRERGLSTQIQWLSCRRVSIPGSW